LLSEFVNDMIFHTRFVNIPTLKTLQ